ncbi:hypothetical protein [Methanobrevibacter arboriphilus]|nr:hypothetical protein [Methanobrevibacter arboriphilus]
MSFSMNYFFCNNSSINRSSSVKGIFITATSLFTKPTNGST